ncbi:MAG: hypothetical protein RIC14_14140 [Filomicrobium sp.]
MALNFDSLKRSVLAVACSLLAGSAMLTAISNSAVAEGDFKLQQAQETLLRTQLLDSYKCDLDRVLFVRRFELGEGTKTEGRIICTDQREIDFVQQNSNERFQLELCQPTVC